uniref:O-acyltransferase WSD1 C-terminal domain-containing protein n=1 Tax=Nelumbo nucifera TaxID=4432 RepID=A0A822Z4E2_NELNU|nr:TPA_asm: hypothetical protein HUJ06_015527 [Nelumbo nucifera]
MKRVGKVSKKARITSLVVLNARMLKGFKTVGDMLKANIWGNRFSLLHVSVPSNVDVNKVDPMDFVVQAKKEMRRRRNSMALFFNNRLLHVLRSIRGPEVSYLIDYLI